MIGEGRNAALCGVQIGLNNAIDRRKIIAHPAIGNKIGMQGNVWFELIAFNEVEIRG